VRPRSQTYPEYVCVARFNSRQAFLQHERMPEFRSLIDEATRLGLSDPGVAVSSAMDHWVEIPATYLGE